MSLEAGQADRSGRDAPCAALAAGCQGSSVVEQGSYSAFQVFSVPTSPDLLPHFSVKNFAVQQSIAISSWHNMRRILLTDIQF